MRKAIYFLSINSYRIVYYTFWIYFAIMIILYVLNIYINLLLLSLFFLFLGLYLGFYFSFAATDYIKKNKNLDNGADSNI